MVGVDYADLLRPISMNFYNSNLKMSSFYRLELQHAKMIGCNLNEVDFVETNLEKVDFSDSDLMGALFDGTNLKQTNLSKAVNYLIDPSKNSLNKTKVSSDEARSFLQFLDLNIVS